MSMGISMGIAIQNSVGMGMGMIFEKGYECGYSSTCPTLIPSPSYSWPPSFMYSRLWVALFLPYMFYIIYLGHKFATILIIKMYINISRINFTET